MKVKTKLRLDQEKILHDDNIVKRSQRYDNYYESICHCSGKNCGSYCNSKIGSGSNGSIRICRNRKNNQLVAVKQVKSTPRAGHEITLHYLISKQSKQNIVQIIDIFLNTDSRGESWFYVVLEYCRDGDLFSLLQSKPNGFLESDIFYLGKQIVDMLNALRVLGIAHCDVKPENILVIYDVESQKSSEIQGGFQGGLLPQLKLADFGFARDVNQPANSKKLLMYTPNYVAPEVLIKRDYGFPCDTWALGVIMFVMATGNFPDTSENSTEIEILHQLKNPQKYGNKNSDKDSSKDQIRKYGENYKSPDSKKSEKPKPKKNLDLQLSSTLIDLFQRIFVIDPRMRITVPEIMNHEWWMIMSNKKSKLMKKSRKQKNSEKSSENSPSLSTCSSGDENTKRERGETENINTHDLTLTDKNQSSGVDISNENNLTQTSLTRNSTIDGNAAKNTAENPCVLKKGEKYKWSESDKLKSLALEAEGSDNGSEKTRSGKSSRSSRRCNRVGAASPLQSDEFGSDDSSENS